MARRSLTVPKLNFTFGIAFKNDVKFFLPFFSATTDPTFVVEQVSIHCARGGPFTTVSYS